MKSPKPEENLVFDYHTIRLLIGVIAVSFPWIISLLAGRITDSISWSYHTQARDLFVGFLFVIGAFLISYKGHAIILAPNQVGKFWIWLSQFWKGALKFRIWERKIEEDLISTMGGIAAWAAALFPTAECLGKNCPSDPASNVHYAGAIILFSTTVYFCLFAFSVQATAKLRKDEKLSGKRANSPKRLRTNFYMLCGWGIAAIMLGLIVLKSARFDIISNLTFWAETAALELFGIAWLIASQYLPFFTDEQERQKLF